MQHRGQQFSDQHLISMIKLKDEKAFGYLYDKYSPLLYGFILNKVQDEKLATEILTKAFMQIWRECKNLDGIEQRLFVWLLSLTCRTAKADFKVDLVIRLQSNLSATG